MLNRYTEDLARRKYRLLIVDGHGNYLAMDFIKYCNKHKIILAIYPPPSTLTLQPLDVVMFNPLSLVYSNQISAFVERCQGLSSENAARTRGSRPQGGPDPRETAQKSGQGPASRRTEGVPWWICVLVSEEDEARHAIRLHQQELEEQQQQHQKIEANKLREETRQAQAQAQARDIQARRQERAEARILREKEKTEKAANQASRAAARRTQQRLEQALKSSQKGKRTSLKAAAKAASAKRVAAVPQGGGKVSGAVLVG